MMGMKQRSFAPIVNVSLEDLVPQDHFYRHLERTLDLSFVRHAVDRLSVLWYLGYHDVGEPLPVHSSLSKIRTRYGIEVFRRFFEAIVEQCQQAGLFWGGELYFDGTKVAANAGKESLNPHFAVEAHLYGLFDTEAEELVAETEQRMPQEEAAGSDPLEQEKIAPRVRRARLAWGEAIPFTPALAGQQ
jgi:hypothetical protein